MTAESLSSIFKETSNAALHPARRARRKQGDAILRRALAGLAFTAAAGAASAQQFTEPPVLLYGKVLHQYDGYELLLREGALEWTIAPSEDPDASFAVTADLQEIGEEFSYRLEVPVERVPEGFTAHAAITASSEPRVYESRTPTIDGREAEILFPDAGPSYSEVHYTERDRGKTRRFDLILTHPYEDSSGDGLPDWWAEEHDLDPSDPSEAARDFTGDGIDALGHYAMGTDPHVFFLSYEAWIADHGLSGDDAAPGADPDHDGVPNLLEFLLDTDPTADDRPLAEARLEHRLVNESGAPAFRVAWEQPDPPRWGLEVAVETSEDLANWETAWSVGLDESTAIDELIQAPEPEADAARYYRVTLRKPDL